MYPSLVFPSGVAMIPLCKVWEWYKNIKNKIIKYVRIKDQIVQGQVQFVEAYHTSK